MVGGGGGGGEGCYQSRLNSCWAVYWFVFCLFRYFLFLVIYTYFYCYENKPGLLDNKWKLTIFIYMLSYVIEIIWHFHQGDIGIKVLFIDTFFYFYQPTNEIKLAKKSFQLLYAGGYF